METLEGVKALSGLSPVEEKTGLFLRQQGCSTRFEEVENLGFRPRMGVSATEAKEKSSFCSTWPNVRPGEGSCGVAQNDAAAPPCTGRGIDILRQEVPAVKYRVSHVAASSGRSPDRGSGVTGLRMARRDSVGERKRASTQAAWRSDASPADLRNVMPERQPQDVSSGISESLYFVILFVDGVTIVEPTLEGVPFSFRLNWVSGADGKRVVSPLYQFKGNVEAYGSVNGQQRSGTDVELEKQSQRHVNTFPPAEWCTYLEGSMACRDLKEVSDGDGLGGELGAHRGQGKIHLLLTYVGSDNEDTEETLALASFSLGQLGTSDIFRRFRLDLLTTAGPFATVTIFAACQRRWIKLGQEIFERRLEAGGVHIAEFLDVEKDDQARFVQQFISREIDLVRQAFASPSRDGEEAGSLKERAPSDGAECEDSESDEGTAKCSTQSDESPAAPSSPSSTYSPRGSTTVGGITLHRISEEQEEEEEKEEASSLACGQDTNGEATVREEVIAATASANNRLSAAKTNQREDALGRGCGSRAFEEQELCAYEKAFREGDVHQESSCLGRRAEECHSESNGSRFFFEESQTQNSLFQGPIQGVMGSAEKNQSSKSGYRDPYFSEDVCSRLTTAGAVGDGSVVASLTVTDHPETTQDAGEVSAFSQTEPDVEHLEGNKKALEGKEVSAEENERFSEGVLNENLYVSESCNFRSHAFSSHSCIEGGAACDSRDQQATAGPLSLGMPEKATLSSSAQRLSPTGEALVRALKELRASVSMNVLGPSNPSEVNSQLNVSKMQTLWLLRDAVALCVKLCEEVVLSDVPSEEKKEAGGYLKVFQYVSQLCHVVSELRSGCKSKDVLGKRVGANAVDGEVSEAESVAMQGKEALVGLTRSLCLDSAKGDIPFQPRIESDQEGSGMKVPVAEVQRKTAFVPLTTVSEASRTPSSLVKDSFCEDERDCNVGGVVNSGHSCEATESEASLGSESYEEPYVGEEERMVDGGGTDNYTYDWQCEVAQDRPVKYGRRTAGPPLQARLSSMKKEAGRDFIVPQSRANARLVRMKMQELEALTRRKEIDDPLQRAHELNGFFRRERSKGLLPAEVQRPPIDASHKDVGQIKPESHVGGKKMDLQHDDPGWRRSSIRWGGNGGAPVVSETWNAKGGEERLLNLQRETGDDQREQRTAQGESERSSLAENGFNASCVGPEQHNNAELPNVQRWPTHSSGWKVNALGSTTSLGVRDSSMLPHMRSVGATRFEEPSTQNKREMSRPPPQFSHSLSLQEFTSMQAVGGEKEDSGMSQDTGLSNRMQVPADKLHQHGTGRRKISETFLQEEIRSDANRVTSPKAAHEDMSGCEKASTTVSGEPEADCRRAPSSVVYRRLPLKATVDGSRNLLQRLPIHLSQGYTEAGRETYESVQRDGSGQGLQRSASFYPPPLPETGHQSLLLQSCHSYADSRHPSTAANGAAAAPPPLREPSQPDRCLRCPPSPMRAFSKDYVPSFYRLPPLNGPVSAIDKSKYGMKKAGLCDTERPPLPGHQGKSFDVVQQGDPATSGNGQPKHNSSCIDEHNMAENKGSKASLKKPKVPPPVKHQQSPHQFANALKNCAPPLKNPFEMEAHFEEASSDLVLHEAHFEETSRDSVLKEATFLRHIRREARPQQPPPFPPRVHQGYERQAISVAVRASNPFSSVI